MSKTEEKTHHHNVKLASKVRRFVSRPGLVAGLPSIIALGLTTSNALASPAQSDQAQTDSPGQNQALPASPSPQSKRFDTGVGLGYGIPGGELSSDDSLRGNLAGLIPIWIDFSYYLTPSIAVGFYASLGFGIGADVSWTTQDLQNTCDDDAFNCPGFDVRAGFQARYRPLPNSSVSPWLAVGLGADVFGVSIEEEVGGSDTTPPTIVDLGDVQAWGFEGNLNAGLDIVASSAWSLGPFADFALGRYESIIFKLGSSDEEVGITDKAIHSWLILGVRGSFSK